VFFGCFTAGGGVVGHLVILELVSFFLRGDFLSPLFFYYISKFAIIHKTVSVMSVFYHSSVFHSLSLSVLCSQRLVEIRVGVKKQYRHEKRKTMRVV